MMQLHNGENRIIFLPRICERIEAQKMDIFFVIFSIISVVCLLVYCRSLNLENYPSKASLYVYLFSLTASSILIIKKICHSVSVIFPTYINLMAEGRID